MDSYFTINITPCDLFRARKRAHPNDAIPSWRMPTHTLQLKKQKKQKPHICASIHREMVKRTNQDAGYGEAGSAFLQHARLAPEHAGASALLGGEEEPVSRGRAVPAAL